MSDGYVVPDVRWPRQDRRIYSSSNLGEPGDLDSGADPSLPVLHGKGRVHGGGCPVTPSVAPGKIKEVLIAMNVCPTCGDRLSYIGRWGLEDGGYREALLCHKCEEVFGR